LIVSIHLLDLDGLVGHVLSKVVILEIDVASPWTQVRDVRKLDASGVVFKDGASKDWSCTGDWNSLVLRFFEEPHHWNRISKRLAKSDVLGFC
jgi:hypothetical protein